MTFDGKKFGAELVETIKGYVDRRNAEIERRLDWIERRLDRAEKLEPAQSAKPKAVVRLPGPRGNGKDAQ